MKHNNKTLGMLLRYILIPLLIAAILIGAFFVSVVCCPPDVFHTSFQSLIQDKFDILMNTQGPKLILVGGSSLGFGIDEALLSEKTGYQVANMGLMAGFGHLFNTEIAKANIQPGDILILAYEYNWMEKMTFTRIGVDNVMTGIDSRIDMYRYLPLSQWPAVIGFLPKYCRIKMDHLPQEGTYSRGSFGENGSMTLERSFILVNYEEEKEHWGEVDLQTLEIHQNSIDYLVKLREYVQDRGAKVFFTSPPLYESAKASDDASFLHYREKVQELTGIPFISNPLDYVFQEEYMFDTIYHCSSLGETRRTEQLAADLAEALKSTG